MTALRNTDASSLAAALFTVRTLNTVGTSSLVAPHVAINRALRRCAG